MGLIEAASSAALTGAIAPFTPYFDFTLEQVDPVTGAVGRRQRDDE